MIACVDLFHVVGALALSVSPILVIALWCKYGGL